MGIRHTVSKDIQVEPQGEGTDDMDSKYIYHYTFGLTPKPTYEGAAHWRLDKRQYYGGYPSDHLAMPPACSAKSGFIIASMWNEAAQNIPGWKTRHPAPAAAAAKVDDLRSRLLAATHVEPASSLADRLRGTGPWTWGQIPRLFLYSRGIAYVPGATPIAMGSIGKWAVRPDGESVALQLCGTSYVLSFADVQAPWRFTATRESGGGAAPEGTLPDGRQHTADMLAVAEGRPMRPHADVERQMMGGTSADAPLVGDIAGSGPWFWAGSGPLSFMRGGVLITPWGEGIWGLRRDQTGEVAPTDAVFADFAGSQHTVRMHNPSCLRMRSVRKADGDVVGVDYAGTGGNAACHIEP